MSELSDDYDDVGSESMVTAESVSDEEGEDGELASELDDEALNDYNFDIMSVGQYNSEINIVPADERQARDVLSVSEMTAIVSIRATQIQDKNNCLVDITGLTDPRKMAMRELMERKCPLYVRRCVDGTGADAVYEIWDPNEMTYSLAYNE
jgi:DNA-directed RNA polymerase subunit K/omega